MLKVVKAQGQGMVSDTGRWGYQREGVPVGGVLDPLSFAIGNMALGNSQNAACLELMGQFDFVCAKPCKVFFANRGAHALLNDKLVRCGQVLVLMEGDVLRTKPPGLGFWNMLCVQGGVDVPHVMGSRSTCLVAGFGGFQGRVLQVGDELHFGGEFKVAMPSSLRLAMPLAKCEDNSCLNIHAIAGPEFSLLSQASQQLFGKQSHVLGAQSSRMGYRLQCTQETLFFTHSISLRSHAVHPGLVQLPPSGNPVVLLNECQVTGGYPRIGSVLRCELWKFTQLSSGQNIRLLLADKAQAARLQLKYEKQLGQYHHVIQSSCTQNHLD